jgi:hypothetical protein
MSKIRSKVHIGGHEKESSWPSRFGTLDKTPMYTDPETGEVKEGYPPRREKLGQAPIVMFDEMPTTRHPGVARDISSRKEWKKADREAGTLTFSSKEESQRYEKQGRYEQEVALKRDRRNASVTALNEWKRDPRGVQQKVEKKTEAQYEQAKKDGFLKDIKE